ncbi:MAG: lipocalin family protein, partial [Bryocella sp.]
GAFYQIARLPDKHQKHCVADSVEIVARADKMHALALVDSCKTKGSYADVRNIIAKREKQTIADGRFKIRTIWPFSRKYWILAVAPDYSWFLVGTPNHNNLWIYSRASSLDDATMDQIKSLAVANGYKLEKLALTVQDAIAPQRKVVIGQ